MLAGRRNQAVYQVTYRDGRSDDECTTIRISVEGWQRLSEEIEVALDVGSPALEDIRIRLNPIIRSRLDISYLIPILIAHGIQVAELGHFGPTLDALAYVH